MNKLFINDVTPTCSAKSIPLAKLSLRNVYQLGTGISSVVVRHNNMAFKIVPFDKYAVQEATLLMNIRFLSQYCLIFGTFHGWFVCSKVPSHWIEDYGFATDLKDCINKGKRLLVLGLQYTRFSLFDFTYTNRDLKYILFILLHGIATARQMIPNFRHRDIHSGNVLIERADELEVITLTLSCGSKIELHDVKYIPKLIDFGDARCDDEKDDDHELYEPFLDEDNRLFEPRCDIFRISLVIMQLTDENEFEEFFSSPEYTKACVAPQDDYVVIEALLKSPFFRFHFKKLKISN